LKSDEPEIMRARVSRRILRGLSEFDGHIVHLTHTDLDAVCCDALFRRKYEPVFTIFSSVQDYTSYLDLLGQTGQTASLTLCLSDLGGRTSAFDDVARLKRKGWRVEWRDHHVWDERFFEDIGSLIDYLRVDRRLCACEIVYADLLEGDEIAKEIAAIGRDRDFWINRDPRSDMLSTTISDDESRAALASKLSQGAFLDADIETMYTLQIGQKNKAISEAIRKSVLIGKTAVTTSNGYTSDVAAKLREKYHSKTEIILRGNGVFSIRTIAPVSNLIAMVFNGGGHPHAAGGNLAFTRRDQIGFKLLRYRLAKVRKLIEVASSFDSR
jgi:oligoribonuclease NrnB/cAMP/cGMP phosphodiesterase (DHH superfamily)